MAAWRTEHPLVGFDQRSNELSTDVSLGFENIRTRIETHELIRAAQPLLRVLQIHEVDQWFATRLLKQGQAGLLHHASLDLPL